MTEKPLTLENASRGFTRQKLCKQGFVGTRYFVLERELRVYGDSFCHVCRDNGNSKVGDACCLASMVKRISGRRRDNNSSLRYCRISVKYASATCRGASGDKAPLQYPAARLANSDLRSSRRISRVEWSSSPNSARRAVSEKSSNWLAV
jgi:hypothetical protein